MSTWQPPTGPGSDPYASPTSAPGFGPRPTKSSLLWLWLLLGFGGLAGMCCCGGVAGLGFFGMKIVTTEVADQLRDNPKFREHIGELQEINVDLVASAAKEGADTFVYKVKGDKGSGTIAVRHITDADGDEQIVEATLRLSDGRQVQVAP